MIRRKKRSPKDRKYPFTQYSTRIYSGTQTKVRTTSFVSRKELKLSTEGGIASGKCSQPDFAAVSQREIFPVEWEAKPWSL